MAKRLRNVLLILLTPWLSYVIFGNLLLATPLLQHYINRNPSRALVTWGRASTWWPGWVHVQDFKLTFTAPKVAFDLTIDDSTARISLSALFHKTFRATRVRSSGVSYRMFTKVDPARAISPRVAAWPHLAGVSPLAVEPPGGGPPMTEQRRKRMWTVNLQDIDTTFREVWIYEYHWKGRGHAAGSFALKPMTSLWVGPVDTTLEPGELTVGDTVVSQDLGGHFQLFITPVEIDMQRKLLMLRGIQLEGHVEATLRSLGFASVYGADATGTGTVAVEAQIKNGALEDGTRVALALSDVKGRLKKNGAGFEGDLAAKGWIKGDVPQLHAVGGGTVYVPLPRDDVVSGFVPRVEADAVTTTNDFTERWRIERFDASVPDLHVADLGPVIDAFRFKLPSVVIPLVQDRQLRAHGLTASGAPDDVHVVIGDARVAETRLEGEADLGGGKPSGDFVVNVAALPIGISVREGKASWQFFPREARRNKRTR